jgi:hypothetical protein
MQHKKTFVATKKIHCNIGGESGATTKKNKIKYLKNCSAISKKCLLQQQKKGTDATFHIMCCNIENESL